jgi:hypothetical protein
MAVKITKPEINIREKIAELDKPSGIAGEAMLRAETPQEQFSLIGAGRKNILINGNFLVGQRDRAITSDYTSTASFRYILDKWQNRPYGTTPHTLRRHEVILPNGDYAYSLKITETGNGGAPFWHLINTPEIERSHLGQTFTVSYWYRTNCPTVQPRYCDSAVCVIIDKDLIADEQWHKIEWQLPCSINATVGSNYQIHPMFAKSSGENILANEYVEIAQVQMEFGEIATTFEHRSYDEELKLCQRYFQKMGIGTSGYSNSSGAAVSFAFRFFTPMRTEPTVTINNTSFAFADTFVSMRNASSPSISYNGFTQVSGSEVTGGELQITTGTTTTASNFQQLYSEDAIWFDADF